MDLAGVELVEELGRVGHTPMAGGRWQHNKGGTGDGSEGPGGGVEGTLVGRASRHRDARTLVVRSLLDRRHHADQLEKDDLPLTVVDEGAATVVVVVAMASAQAVLQVDLEQAMAHAKSPCVYRIPAGTGGQVQEQRCGCCLQHVQLRVDDEYGASVSFSMALLVPITLVLIIRTPGFPLFVPNCLRLDCYPL